MQLSILLVGCSNLSCLLLLLVLSHYTPKFSTIALHVLSLLSLLRCCLQRPTLVLLMQQQGPCRVACPHPAPHQALPLPPLLLLLLLSPSASSPWAWRGTRCGDCSSWLGGWWDAAAG
jgi:hypothetical protein